METCQKLWGAVDILVNNAGQITPITRLAESDPDQWFRAAEVNYRGTYHGLRAALPAMLNQGRGTIVNVSSGAAVSHLEGWSHYCSSKAACLSLTGCADREYRARGIRILGLSPGTVATDMQAEIRKSGINPVSRLRAQDHIPASWAARAIAFLCTNGADAFLGQDFSLKIEENRQRLGLAA